MSCTNRWMCTCPLAVGAKIPLPLNSALISDLKIQHANLPSLQVKLIHGIDSVWANELDQALLWLNETIGQPYPLIGLHVESDHSSIRMLQLSTSSRCVIIRIPDRASIVAQAQQAAAANSNDGCTLFTPLFYQLMSNRGIFKSGLEACTDALQLYRLFDLSSLLVLRCACSASAL